MRFHHGNVIWQHLLCVCVSDIRAVLFLSSVQCLVGVGQRGERSMLPRLQAKSKTLRPGQKSGALTQETHESGAARHYIQLKDVTQS